MLEDLAYAYSQTSAVASTALNYLFIVAGALIGWVTNRSMAELARAPYFGLTGIMLFALAVFGLIEAQFLVPAMASGVLWMVLAAEFAALMAVGFGIARIASARSRHSTGGAGLAFLAFIPIANLWLLFKVRPAGWPPSPSDSGHALSGTAGVITGIVLSVGVNLLNTAASTSAERNVTRAAESGELDRAFLPDLLRGIADRETAPRTIDEVTTLNSVRAGASTLHYIYTVDLGGRALTDAMRARVIEVSCANASLLRVLKAGGTVTMAYRTPDGQDLLTVDMTMETCSV